jgi:hypothetical protein
VFPREHRDNHFGRTLQRTSGLQREASFQEIAVVIAFAVTIVIVIVGCLTDTDPSTAEAE